MAARLVFEYDTESRWGNINSSENMLDVPRRQEAPGLMNKTLVVYFSNKS